jgi:ATP-dependent DNA helicase RecQ
MVIRQALITKFLTKDIENYGLLKVTPGGMDFLKKPVSFMLAEDHDYADTTDEENAFGAKTAAVDEELFSILKDLRKKDIKAKGCASFCHIPGSFSRGYGDPVPITSEELQNISGVGAGKAQRYGEEFVELIKKICREKEIYQAPGYGRQVGCQ